MRATGRTSFSALLGSAGSAAVVGFSRGKGRRLNFGWRCQTSAPGRRPSHLVPNATLLRVDEGNATPLTHSLRPDADNIPRPGRQVSFRRRRVASTFRQLLGPKPNPGGSVQMKRPCDQGPCWWALEDLKPVTSSASNDARGAFGQLG